MRRQVPERWRFVLPLPAAAFGYGVLLGLGWTTYVLTLAVWALFALSFALGDPAVGLAAGLAFGAGRALPIVLVAPILDRPLGLRVAEAMAERPGILRGLRTVDGAALAACLVAVLPATGAHAATRVAAVADDPSVASGGVLWETGTGRAVLSRAGKRQAVRAPHAVIGGHQLASVTGPGAVSIAPIFASGPTVVVRAPGAGKLAVSDTWVVWRAVTARGDRMYALNYRLASARPILVSSARAPTQLSRPALDGDRLVYATAGTSGSSLRTVNLHTGRRLRLAHAVETQYLNPSLRGSRLLFVRTTHCAQALVLRRLGARPVNRVLLHAGPLGTRDEGHEHGYSPQGSEPTKCHPERPRARSVLWTTALGSRAAYVVALRSGRGRLLRVTR